MADINASPFYTSVCRILIFPTCVWKKIRDDDPYVVFINYLPINGALSLRFFRSSSKFNVSTKFTLNLTQRSDTYDRTLSIFCRLYAFPTDHKPPSKPFKSLEISRFPVIRPETRGFKREL